jgi:hypothetical protein
MGDGVQVVKMGEGGQLMRLEDPLLSVCLIVQQNKYNNKLYKGWVK